MSGVGSWMPLDTVVSLDRWFHSENGGCAHRSERKNEVCHHPTVGRYSHEIWVYPLDRWLYFHFDNGGCPLFSNHRTLRKQWWVISAASGRFFTRNAVSAVLVTSQEALNRSRNSAERASAIARVTFSPGWWSASAYSCTVATNARYAGLGWRLKRFMLCRCCLRPQSVEGDNANENSTPRYDRRPVRS